MAKRTDAEAAMAEKGRKNPRLPGADFPTPGPVPLARIFLAPSDPGRSGLGRAHDWILKFEPWVAPFIEPLMGWTGGRDSYGPIELHFPDRESAVAFAARQGWACEVVEPPQRMIRPRSYAEDLKRRLRTSASPLAELRGQVPILTPGKLQEARRDIVAIGERNQHLIDPVEEAGIESFPASDPPAWTGASIL